MGGNPSDLPDLLVAMNTNASWLLSVELLTSRALSSLFPLTTFFSFLYPTPDSLYPTPDSLYPTPDSLYPTPDSLYPTPDSLYPTPDSL
ncbi:hypothetical protein Pmani_030314 [Petrolisthes manimaculis]|uniref:Uncharacterized protein n=1 Tax=Petrolisthes manimaculis TaxID=1843537 RepID=A0AAE1NVT3_9EUCA|nr:hypothetical protein Pmani_030314 [Petrolisthes manimaculis]